MATRSTISVVQEDNSVKSVYCHWDGYIIGGVGEALQTYFNTEEDANNVISEGSLSSINKDSFESYYSKRGEAKVSEYYGTLESFLSNLEKQEFNYLFIDGEWKIIDSDNEIKEIFEYNSWFVL
jgi:hypothetical protein